MSYVTHFAGCPKSAISNRAPSVSSVDEVGMDGFTSPIELGPIVAWIDVMAITKRSISETQKNRCPPKIPAIKKIEVRGYPPADRGDRPAQRGRR